jgi:hypothetical protein
MAAVVLAAVGCGGGDDDGGGGGADAGGGGGADAAGADAAAVFEVKDDCKEPAVVAMGADGEILGRPVMAWAPGVGVVLRYDRQQETAIGNEVREYTGGAWGDVTVAHADGQATLPGHLAAGGDRAVTADEIDDTGDGYRRRLAGGTWAAADAIDLVEPTSQAMAVGAGGHAVHAWHSNGVALRVAVAPPDDAFVELDPSEQPAPLLAAVIDGEGDGMVVGTEGDGVWARAFRDGAWAGDDEQVVTENVVFSQLTAALLPDGDAYVVWTNGGDAPAVYGATAHADGDGLVTWSSVDTLHDGAVASALVADSDGDLTVLFAEDDGALMSRRRIGGGAWSDDEPVGDHAMAFIPVAVDAAGHVTVALDPGDGTIWHRRIEKGATAWADAVRVDAAAGAGEAEATDLALALEPATGDPVLVWRAAGGLLYAICR